GRLERAGEQVLLAHRLRGVLGVDARGAEEDQALDARGVCGLDDVERDGEVVGDEVGRVGSVGEDAADAGGREHDEVGALALEEALGVALAAEVELRGGAQEEVAVAGLLEASDDGRADEPPVPRHVDLFVWIRQMHTISESKLVVKNTTPSNT